MPNWRKGIQGPQRRRVKRSKGLASVKKDVKVLKKWSIVP